MNEKRKQRRIRWGRITAIVSALIVVFGGMAFFAYNFLLGPADLGDKPGRFDEKEYAELMSNIHKERENFKQKFIAAGKNREEKVINEAEEYIFNALTREIFPAWLGTRWEFAGDTFMPRRGSIACGYFVATTLVHAGFILPREQLARQPSENIVLNLVQPENIKRFSGKDINYIKKVIEAWGRGIYVAGLDTHVGFIVNDGEKIKFVHSSGMWKVKRVVAQPILSNNPLARSRYRVIGRLMDDEMTRKWILGERFDLKYDYFKTAQ